MTQLTTIAGQSPREKRRAAKGKFTTFAAHKLMVEKLLTLLVPRPIIGVEAEPEDFRDRSEYALAVADIVDECFATLGAELQSVAPDYLDLDLFTGRTRLGIEGDATYALEQQAKTLEGVED